MSCDLDLLHYGFHTHTHTHTPVGPGLGLTLKPSIVKLLLFSAAKNWKAARRFSTSTQSTTPSLAPAVVGEFGKLSSAFSSS